MSSRFSLQRLLGARAAAEAAVAAAAPPAPVAAGSLTFRCNICGQYCFALMSQIDREVPSCSQCGSTVRFRAIVHALSSELYGKSLALPDFPERRDLKGIGMSDWEGYARLLSVKFDYQNTHYHMEPRLDIAAIDPSLEGRVRFRRVFGGLRARAAARRPRL